MKKTLLLSFFSLLILVVAAQNDTPLDSFITKSGIVYKGKMLEDRPGDYFKFRTTENSELTVPYNSVSGYFFYVPPVVVKVKPEKVTKQRPWINEAAFARRNSGIVLTSIGLAVFGGGIALIATNPAGQHKYSNANGSGINFTGNAAGGFVMVLVSPALFISGAILWAKAANKIRNERERKRVKDL